LEYGVTRVRRSIVWINEGDANYAKL